MKTKKFAEILPRSEIGCSMSISDTENKVTIHTPGNYSLVITCPTVVIDEVLYKSLEERVKIYEKALSETSGRLEDIKDATAKYDGDEFLVYEIPCGDFEGLQEIVSEALKSGRGE